MLKEFLVKAKQATYASQGEANERNLPDGGKELTFEEREYRYRDLYYGFDPFAGQEVVWKGDEFIWSMTYYGEIV